MTRMSKCAATPRGGPGTRATQQWRIPLLLLGLCSQPGFAQLNPAFASVVKDPRQQKLVTDAARQSAAIQERPCAKARYTVLDKFSVLQPLTFDKSTGVLNSGTWKQVIHYTGCGVSKYLNVLVSADRPRMDARPLLPGTTLTGPQLQLDVFRSPALQRQIARWRDADCTMAYVADTAFVEQQSEAVPGAASPPWREIWTLAACDRTNSVLITFAPDATGTSFQFSEVPPDADPKP